MKKFIMLCSCLVLGILVFLTSCGGKEELPAISASLDVKPFKTAITVDTKFVDTDEHDLYNNNVKVYVTLNSTDEKAKEITRTEVTIVKPDVPIKVVYNALGGSEVKTATPNFGSTISAPTAPKRAGCTFDGWYKDLEFKTKFEFNKEIVRDNIVLYAKWTKKELPITTESTLPTLDVPTITINEEGLATWTEVANATGYMYSINGGTQTKAEEKSVQLENGNFIQVKAIGDGVNQASSAWSSSSDFIIPEQVPEFDEIVIAKEMTGAQVKFSSNVEADTKYLLKLIMSSKGNQKVLATKEVTTINNGESADDPIIINNLDDLLGMSNERNAYYELAADIDCGGDTLNPIFSSSNAFSGHLNGKGHKIFNFKFANIQNYFGVFGYMSGATVTDLVIEDASCDISKSTIYFGALAGYVKKCHIDNVRVNNISFIYSSSGSTSVSYFGGMIGQCSDSTIENCSVNNVSLKLSRSRLRFYIGGFIGNFSNSKVSNCSVSGSIKCEIEYTSNEDGYVFIGGFVGVNDSSLGINDSFAAVDLSIDDPDSSASSGYKTFKYFVGGFAGGNSHNVARFMNCASVGEINVKCKSAYNVYVGGLVGYLDDNNVSRVTNCVYCPKGDGVKVDLMTKLTDGEIPQTAYVSLGIGYIGSKSTNEIKDVFASQDKLVIENEHNNLSINDCVISSDLGKMPDAIKDAIQNALNPVEESTEE